MGDRQIEDFRTPRVVSVGTDDYDQTWPVFAGIANAPGPGMKSIRVMNDQANFRIR